jgi:WD40 repeat protein
MIASVSADHTLRFWQPTLGRLVRFTRLAARPLSVAWLSDGQRVAVGCEDGRVRILHCETLELVSDQIAAEGWIHDVETAHGADETVAAGGSRAQWTLLQPEERITPRP